MSANARHSILFTGLGTDAAAIKINLYPDPFWHRTAGIVFQKIPVGARKSECDRKTRSEEETGRTIRGEWVAKVS